MDNTNNFYKTFRYIIIIMCCSGIYIPGMKVNFGIFKQYNIVLYYCIYLFIVLSYNCVDWFSSVVLNLDIMPQVFVFHYFMSVGIYLWNVINYSYVLLKMKAFEEIIDFWQTRLYPFKNPEIKQKYINIANKKTLKKLIILQVIMGMPYVIIGIYKTATGGLYLASYFGYGITFSAPRWASFLQMQSNVVLNFNYPAYQCTMTLFQRIIIAELEYLTDILNEVLTKPEVLENGYLRLGSKEIIYESFDTDLQREYLNIRKTLKQLAHYYAEVLYFGNKIKVLYRNVITFEFFFLTTITCALVHGVTTGEIPIETVAYTMLCSTSYFFITMLSCKLGDQILKQSYAIGETALYGNWMAYPVDIQKIIFMIIKMSFESPIIFDFHGFIPVLSETFLTLVMTQYRFFRFMSDTIR